MVVTGDDDESILTKDERENRYDWIQEMTKADKPNVCSSLWSSVAWSRVSKAADISRAVRIVIFPESIFSKCRLFEQSCFSRGEFAVRRLKRTETGRNRNVGEKACKSKSLQNFAIVLRLEMGLKLEGSEFDKPGFFKRGEMSASLKLVGKVVWENDRFARWEMRREKVSAHDFKREDGI